MNARFLASEVKPIPTALLDIKHPMTITYPKAFRNSERDKALKPPDVLPDQFFDEEGNRIWSRMPSGAHQCELCGFKAVTKNKYREKQDHMAKWHFSKRLELIIPQNTKKPFLCPDCHYTGKDRQCVMRHYTGKHNVLDIWTNEFLHAINNKALTPSIMYMIENVNFNAKRGGQGEKVDQVKFFQPKPLNLATSAETFKCILCKDEPFFDSRKSLALHVEMAHAHSRVTTNEILKNTVGITFFNNSPKSPKKRSLVQSPNTTIIKKVRSETLVNAQKLVLQEVKDSGLVCVTCKNGNHLNEEEEDTSLMQSITELQSHILSSHTDLVVCDSFVLIQNTAAGPGKNTFTYYLCTQCGKCFSRTSPETQLRDHISSDCCQSTNNNVADVPTTKTVDTSKSDIIASIRNNNENLAKLLKEISPSVSIIPRPAAPHSSSLTALNLSLSKTKKKEHCPCEFCINPNFSDVKLHKCYVEPTCGKTFSKVTHLKAHVRSHNNERPYQCDWNGCGKTFVRSDELKRHAWIHTKEDR